MIGVEEAKRCLFIAECPRRFFARCRGEGVSIKFAWWGGSCLCTIIGSDDNLWFWMATFVVAPPGHRSLLQQHMLD